jgi:regulator of protease activity HflC (stomatin/prohibitin superfamily)
MFEKVIIILVLLALIIAIILAIKSTWNKLFSTYTIYDYERGVKFHKGKFSEIIGPGKYTYFNSVNRIEVFDMRPTILQINGQELLSADNVSVKVSLVVNYQILDPHVLFSNYENFNEYLYMTVQLKIREIISSLEIDDILSNRKVIKDKFKEVMLNDVSLTGLTIQTVDIKDIMLSAELKKVYMEAIKVKKEALASLEKARGEMATLRSLANAAKMLEKNPELVKLRLIQTIESSQGNTFVIDTNHQVREVREEK